jgi:hypothetical protein
VSQAGGRKIVIAVDVPALWRAVAVRLFRTEKTAREIANLLGFSPQVMTDLKQAAASHGNYQPSAPVLLSLAWWLGRPADDFRLIQSPSLPDPSPIVRSLEVDAS